MADFLDPKQLWFIIAVLLGVIVALAAGRGLGALIIVGLKKIIGKDSLTVNIGAEDRALMAGDRERMAGDRLGMADDREHMAGDRLGMAGDRARLSGHACLIPEDCPQHSAENARSLQNKADIEALKVSHKEDLEVLKASYKADRSMFWKELKGIRSGITCITNGLLAKQIISPRDLPKED